MGNEPDAARLAVWALVWLILKVVLFGETQMQHNIFAFTDAGFAPQFLSVNHDGKGRYEVTVRSAAMGDEAYGAIATVVLDAQQFHKLADVLFSFASGFRS